MRNYNDTNKNLSASDTDMPEIKPEHYARRDFLEYCKWVLLDIVKYADEHNLSQTDIVFHNDKDKEEYAKICKQDTEIAKKWLIDNDYEDVINISQHKHLFFSLIVDFSNYYNASLDLAWNKNISAAWALMRKPLQDTLAYIEWLYLEPNDIVRKLRNSKDVNDYELKLEHKKSNINKIYGEQNDIFEFRYDRNADVSLQGILNAANHLITTHNASFKTKPSSLNFVFSTKDIVEQYIGFYYTSLPMIMYNATELIMKIFERIAGINNYSIIMNRYNLRLKNLKALQTMSLEEAMDLLDIKVPIICGKCGKEMNSLYDWKQFAYHKCSCQVCKNDIDTFGYIFDFENITFATEEDKNEQ